LAGRKYFFAKLKTFFNQSMLQINH
jgi:hypothetical protein